MVTGSLSGRVISAIKVLIQRASFAACVAVMYSASVVESATIGCFFKLQETTPPSIVNM